VAEDVGFALGEATSKRDRVLSGLRTADRRTLGAIAERLGRRFSPTTPYRVMMTCESEGPPALQIETLTVKNQSRSTARLRPRETT
jgi:hypothetical protein